MSRTFRLSGIRAPLKRKNNNDRYYMNNYMNREGVIHPNNNPDDYGGMDLSMTGTSVDGSLHIPVGEVYPDELSSIGTFSMVEGRPNNNGSTSAVSFNDTALPTSSPTVVLDSDQPTFNPEDSSTINGRSKRRHDANGSNDPMLEDGFDADGNKRRRHLEGNRQINKPRNVGSEKDPYYIPTWIAESSGSLRALIVTSIMLLVGSVLLVVVAIVISTNTEDFTPNSSNYVVVTPPPSSTIIIGIKPTSTPTPKPVKAPTQPPLATAPDVDTTSTTFYVIAGENSVDPNSIHDVFQKFPNSDGDWLVHMGDLFAQDPSSSTYQCDSQSYEDVSTTYSTSSIPVLFVPGEKDYSNCPLPTTAWQHWINYLANYSANGIIKPGIVTQENHPENFAMVQGKVLFLGLNMIEEMNVQNLDWVTTNVESRKADLEVAILFGRIAYTEGLNSDDFFDPLLELINDWNQYQNLVFLYITKSTKDWNIKQKYLGSEKLMLLNIQTGIWPPMQISINTNDDTMRFDQDGWYKNLML